MSPQQINTLLQQATVHHRAGRLTEAAALYRRLQVAAPQNFDVLHLSGLVALQQGAHREAADLLHKALKRNPTSAVCAMRLGVTCYSLGELILAERYLRQAIKHDQKLPEAWCNLAITLTALGRLPEARAAYETALKLKPDYPEVHDRLGALACRTDGFGAAVPHFRRVTELEPKNVTAWANLGASLAQSGGTDEALVCFERALAINPSHPLALTARSLAWQLIYRIPEAVAGYAEVIEKFPAHFEARSARLLAQHYLDNVDRAALFTEHEAFGFACGETVPVQMVNTAEPERRLRVAFLSADLRRHSVAYFLEPLLAHLDPEKFEVYLYHDHPQVDEMSAKLRARAALWRNFSGQGSMAVETSIRGDAPDILVDLGGHTGINRLPLFARRLAPVQVTWLGYPDTTGLRAMDYRFVDAVTDPIGEAEAFHTEKLVRFAETAWTYQAPIDAPEPAEPPSISGQPVTFGCFNNFAKVSDSTLAGWAKILAALPESRLLLKGHGLSDPGLAAALRSRLAKLGVAEERVELLGRTPGIVAHLELYSRMDVALDTFPYHGTTTTCEALWMGLPVVTLAGDRHASRVGVSLLRAIRRSEWVASDWDEYTSIAVNLAKDVAGRKELRRNLRGEMRQSPLLDHAGQASRFGSALRDCWRKWCERPESAAGSKAMEQHCGVAVSVENAS